MRGIVYRLHFARIVCDPVNFLFFQHINHEKLQRSMKLMRYKNNLVSKIFFTVILSVILLISENIAVAQTNNLTDSIKQVGKYYQQQTTMDEWEILATRWAGISNNAELVFSQPEAPSDYARSIFGAIAANGNPEHIKAQIGNLEAMQKETGYFSAGEGTDDTLNQTIWPLIALDFAAANQYDTNFNRAAALEHIIAGQSENGGFDESGWGVDVDSTAHALVSLAPYGEDHPQTVPVIQQALAYLKTQQYDTGGFGGWGAANPDTTAAVIEAFYALGMDPADPEWQVDGQTMVDALLEFQSPQGWFVYSTEASEWNDPTTPNKISTRNALMALGDLAADASKYRSVLPPLTTDEGNGKEPGDNQPGNGTSSIGRVFVTISGSPETGTIMPRQEWVWWSGNPTVMDALLGVLHKNNIEYRITSNGYVASLGGLEEKLPGFPNSGWLYTINDKFYPVGAAAFKIREADEIRWLYTVDGGADVGNPFATGEKSGGDTKPIEDHNQILEQKGSLSTELIKPQLSGPEDCKEFLVAKGIVQGTEKGFEWDRNISRAELAQMLYSLAGSPSVVTKAIFEDTEEQQWFYPAVSFVTEQRIMVGYPSGDFHPHGLVDRFQMAVIIKNWLQANLIEPGKNQSVDIEDQLPDWAAESVGYMLDTGFMKPVSNSFAGEQLVNREDTAVLICRAWEAMQKGN